LIGYGAAAGDPAAQSQTIEQMIELLQTPPPWRRDLEPIYSSLAAMKKPVEWPFLVAKSKTNCLRFAL
ncbi:MAG: hypothetical protein WB052_17195, partial [Pseudolabrys sp.]